MCIYKYISECLSKNFFLKLKLWKALYYIQNFLNERLNNSHEDLNGEEIVIQICNYEFEY